MNIPPLRQVISVGPKNRALRGSLAILLALAGAGQMAVVSTAAAETSARSVAGLEVRADSVSGWLAMRQREGHSLNETAMLANIYRGLAGPTFVGRRGALDADTRALLSFRDDWRRRFERPIKAGGAQAMRAAFVDDAFRRVSSSLDEGGINALGFDQSQWKSIVRGDDIRVSGGWRGLETSLGGQGGGVSDAERERAIRRMQTHTDGLGMGWIRLPWGALDNTWALDQVEQKMIALSAGMQRITGWRDPASGLGGTVRWDLARNERPDEGALFDGGAVYIRGEPNQFAGQWFSAAAQIDPKADHGSANNRNRLISNGSLNTLFDSALRGNGAQALENLAERTARKALRTGTGTGSTNGSYGARDLDDIDPDHFSVAVAQASRGEISQGSLRRWQASLADLRGHIRGGRVYVDESKQHNSGMGL